MKWRCVLPKHIYGGSSMPGCVEDKRSSMPGAPRHTTIRDGHVAKRKSVPTAFRPTIVEGDGSPKKTDEEKRAGTK